MYSIAFSPKELLSIPNEKFAFNHKTFDACFGFNAFFGNTYPQDTGQCDQSDIQFMHERLFGSLRWRHNGHDGVSNHQHHHCLLNPLFRRRSKKTLKLRVTGLCVGNSPATSEFPAQMASNAENDSIWWRHHGLLCYHIQDNDPLFLLYQYKERRAKRGDHTLDEVIGGGCAGLQSGQAHGIYENKKTGVHLRVNYRFLLNWWRFWRHQAISWTNVDLWSVKTCDKPLWAISREIPHP